MRGTVLLLQHGLGALSYRLPDGTPPGTVVLAPLGPRRVPGVLWDEGVWQATPVDAAKLREALPLDLPPLPAPLRRLLDFVAGYYLAPPAAVLRMALPQAAFVPAARAPTRYRLGALPASRHPGRRALLERLEAVRGIGPAPLAVWAAAAETRVESLRALARQGVLQPAGENGPAAVPPPRPALPPGPRLGAAQQAAADALCEAVQQARFQPFLLDGVTGAGKTEVYLEAVAQAIAGDGQALVLLPEIALTQAWLQRFGARFGFAPVVWHSGLTPSARRDAFRQIVSGEASVVVGARSALFLGHPGCA